MQIYSILISFILNYLRNWMLNILRKTPNTRNNYFQIKRKFASSIKKFDAIIVGGGHNGLICSNYLAQQNMKVLVLERRHVLGGAAVSEEIFPGYVFSRASYVLSLLRKKVIEEIFPENWRDELVLFERKVPSFTPTRDGKYLRLTSNE